MINRREIGESPKRYDDLPKEAHGNFYGLLILYLKICIPDSCTGPKIMRSDRKNYTYCILIISLFLSSVVLTQDEPGIYEEVYHRVYGPDTTIILDNKFILSGTETITLDQTIGLERGTHYLIDYRYGKITIIDMPFEAKDLLPGVLHISYRYLPLTFSDTYRLYEFTGDTLPDDLPGRTVGRSRVSVIDDIFTSQLRTSGSLIRGLSLGTNRDLTLQSGFRMQLSGNLSERVEIAATLTDENTPIQPEGTTQTLRELDKVYIQIFSDDYQATFGDFDLNVTGTEFSRLNRRLQGAKGEYRYSTGYGNGEVMVTGAGMRGKYHTMEFRGQEGVQGPYRLTGRNNERAIIIVPGSERVYIDGQQMIRGENNDYVIEYGNGEVVFTAQRLITSASRIVVDFEYTDRQYNRNFLGAQSRQNLFDDRVSLSFGYYRESDDRDSPIDFILDDEELAILSASGTDRFEASRTSVREVGFNEETGRGNGQYIRRDTTIAGNDVVYFEFDPGAPEAVYSIGFSFVGEGNGDYRRVAAGQFTYAGPGQGSYLPLQFLPMPQLHQIGTAAMQYNVADHLRVFGEYAFSSFDGNRFSSIGNEFNDGNAYTFGVSYSPDNVTLMNRAIGSFDLDLRQRYVNNRFVSMDRINEIEFNRQWDLSDTLTGDEMIREASFVYKPADRISFGTSYGTIERGEIFQSKRYDGTVHIDGGSLPSLWYYIESIHSDDRTQFRRGDWLRQRGRLSYNRDVRERKRISTGLFFEHEDRDIHSTSVDSLLAGSFSFFRIVPRFEIDEIARMSVATEFEFREDSEFLQGANIPESRSLTSRTTWRLRDWNSLSSRIDFTYRTKNVTEAFRQEGSADDETILIRSQTRYSPLRRFIESDLFYEVTTQRSARLERVFVRVPKGTGNYRYLGDLNNNGIADEDEFELVRFDGDYIVVTVPTDELFPVVDLRSSFRLRLTPSRILGEGNGLLAGIIRRFSTDTNLRLEEKSRDPRTSNIYLVRLSTFRNEAYTIIGSHFITQDVFLNEQSRDFSMRFRYMERQGMNQFSLGVEKSNFIERSVRLRWQLVEEIGHQIDIISRRDRVSATQPSNRERAITSNTILSDLSYRPQPLIEVGFVLEVTSADDVFPGNPVEASINAQTLRVQYSMRARGQVRTEFSREQVIVRQNRPEGMSRHSFPFELTGGRVEGLSWLWRAAFDYRISRFIQASIQYDGRAEHDRPVIHQGRGEVRVFF